mmetsp:Transcript_29003/g.47898  ORF Transcript_29003/g.47898 Transcript_29003/m.47898 type:complete len:207 (+) Transcript_29003:112-732(+)
MPSFSVFVASSSSSGATPNSQSNSFVRTVVLSEERLPTNDSAGFLASTSSTFPAAVNGALLYFLSSICVSLVSIEDFTIIRMISTCRFCPRRWTRPIACWTAAGFIEGSKRKTLLALVRLIPQLDDLMLRRNTVVGGSFWNAVRAAARFFCVIWPLICLNVKPCFGSSSWSHLRVDEKLLNTRLLLLGSSSRIRVSSAINVLSLLV